MPNGFYPIQGLEVILLNRTEQDHPTLRWRQFHDVLQAVCLTSHKGYWSFGPVDWQMFGNNGLQGMQRAIQNTLAEAYEREKVQDSRLMYGDGITVNFSQRRGIAFGAWFIYRINDQGTELIHGGGAPGHVVSARTSLIQQMPPERRIHFQRPMCTIEPPIRYDDPIKKDTPASHFEFDAHDDLIISTLPLHFDKHWPVKTLIDAACVMLTQERHCDELLILWKNPDRTRDEYCS